MRIAPISGQISIRRSEAKITWLLLQRDVSNESFRLGWGFILNIFLTQGPPETCNTHTNIRVKEGDKWSEMTKGQYDGKKFRRGG